MSPEDLVYTRSCGDTNSNNVHFSSAWMEMVENCSFLCKSYDGGVMWKLSVAMHINVHITNLTCYVRSEFENVVQEFLHF